MRTKEVPSNFVIALNSGLLMQLSWHVVPVRQVKVEPVEPAEG